LKKFYQYLLYLLHGLQFSLITLGVHKTSFIPTLVHILLIVLAEQIYYTILTINKQLLVKKEVIFNEEK